MNPLTLPLLAALAASPVPASAPAVGKPIDPANQDASIAACQDFYGHAVGGWQKANPIPADRARYGAFEELAERNRATLKAILEESSARSDWPKGSIQQKVGDFYASGMDEAAIEKAGVKPIQPWLDRIAKLQAKDLPAYLAASHASGLHGGFRFAIDQDEKASTRYVVLVRQGGLGLPDRDYYLKDDARSKELREKYLAHVGRMLELSGEKPDQARADATAVLALETRLAQASRTRVEMRDPQSNYNKRTLAQLEAEAPGFGWGAYLGALGVPKDQDLDVGQPAFAKAFAALVASEPLPAWRTYLRWHALASVARFLPRAFEDERFAFYGGVLQGVEKQEDRWKRVLDVTDDELGEALGQLYVEKAFGPQQKERMKTLVENLRTVLRERIDGLQWMGPETKAAAQKKLAAFGVKIGYPDRWRDYSALTISRGASYLENVLAAEAFDTRRNVAKLGKPIDRTEWGMSPPTVNAYYNSSMNEIVFPAGILQPPFFWPEGDDAVNYGAIGVVIGHEMTHGFDDRGSQYDAEGNLSNWWTEADRKAYEARTDLMVKQFDGYRPFADASINGKLTLGENIADLGGLKIAWAALAKALGQDPNRAPPVEGLTPGQRFFLSYANVWRNNVRDEALRVTLATNPHSPGKWRVLGPTSNLPEFHAAFSCGPGSAMNRPEAERPVIW